MNVEDFIKIIGEAKVHNNELTFMIGEQMFEATAMGENNNHVVVTLVKKDITMEQILAEPVKEKPAANTEKEKTKGIGMPKKSSINSKKTFSSTSTDNKTKKRENVTTSSTVSSTNVDEKNKKKNKHHMKKENRSLGSRLKNFIGMK